MREGELRGPGKLIRREPAQLDEVVAGQSIAARMRSPSEAEHDPFVVRLEPEPEEVDRLDLERGLFTDLASQTVERMLVLVEEPSRQIPETLARIGRASPEEHPALVVEADRLCAGNGVRVADVAAGPALGTVLDLVDSLAADRTEAPVVEHAHGRDLARSSG